MWDEAKDLIRGTRELVTGAAHSEERLGLAAEESYTTVVRLIAAAIKFAESLPVVQQSSQASLLEATSNVAQAYVEMVLATTEAVGKTLDDQPMRNLMDKAKGMAQIISSLMRTLRAIETSS